MKPLSLKNDHTVHAQIKNLPLGHSTWAGGGGGDQAFSERIVSQGESGANGMQSLRAVPDLHW